MLLARGDVLADERRVVAGAFLTLLGILAGHTLLETARDALFLARLPASRLPWMYIAIAGGAFAFSRLRGGRFERLWGTHGLSLLLLVSAALTGAFWVLSSWRSPWSLYALYTWSGLFGTAAGVRFWLTLSEMFTVTQAKRLYRLIATGSVLGAVCGAGAAGLIASRFPAGNLLLASSLILAVTGLGPALLLKRPPSEGTALGSAPFSLRDAVSAIREDPYVRPLAGLVLSSTIGVTMADYLFKSAVAQRVPPEQLGAFFASFYVVLNVLALFVQVFAVGWLLRLVGIHRALWVLPFLLMLGALGVLVGGGFFAALWLKGVDGSLRYTLHRTSTELLYVPLSDALRARVKPFIDVAGQRGGQVLASLILLTPIVFIPQWAFLSLSLCIMSVLWMVTAAHLKDHYLDLFRSALREGAIVNRMDLPGLDLGSLEALFAALNSREDSEVVAAMELLADEGKVRLIPALILYHPAAPVVLRALELFVTNGRGDFVPVAQRLLEHPNPEVRAGALRALSVVAPDESTLRAASKDASPLVSATALVGLVSGGWISDEAQAALDTLLASQSPEASKALARAVALQPADVFEEILLELAEAPEEDILVQVAQAMAAVKSERFLPALLPMLAQREVRGPARAAFLAHGEKALAFLEAALGKHALPQELRRHIPRTISLFAPQRAAPMLLEHLLTEPDGMVRFKILRGLGRLRADHRNLRLDRAALDEATKRTVETAFRLVHWRLVLERGAASDGRRKTSVHDLLATLLHDKEVHAIERLFRLLGIARPDEDFDRIHRGLRSASPKVSSTSRELLEHLIEPPLREALLALLDEASPDRLEQSLPYYAPAHLDYEELLALLIEQASESLCCLAVYHVGELGLGQFRARLEALPARGVGLFASRVIERALAQLPPPEGPEVQRV